MSAPLFDPQLTKLELEMVVRVIRQYRDTIMEQKLLLQERELSIGDGHVREAILQCENTVFILTGVVGKLWRQIYPASGPPRPD